MESNYDFRERLLKVHEDNIRDASRTAEANEYELSQSPVISIDGAFSDVTETAVRDFADFLNRSMGIDAAPVYNESGADIRVALADTYGVDLGEAASYKGFMIEVCESGISVYGNDERGIGQGLYYIEMLMAFEKAPVIKLGNIKKKPMFSPRMVHSGYGVDEYPDEYLCRIAHEGRDAILVFTKGINEVPHGYLDFNDLIERARRYGLDVYAYSFLKSNVSPEAPEAEEYYDNVYGKLFRECPGLKGVTLVGESVEFPSKDPHVTKGKYYETAVDGIPSDKPSSGWYPCYDYPIWLELLKKTIRKYRPDADIVFWTYNWGYQSEEARVKLIESLPTDISLQATFEMFEPRYYGSAEGRCSDYSLAFEGPGKYFESEAVAARKRGIRLYSMTNTGGLTWDFGVIPYEPMPYQWMKRYSAMIRANRDWGLCGLMESHHFGFYPSFITKLSNLAFLEPLEDMEEILKKILISEFGEESYEKVDSALRCWSEAIRHYVPSNENQYGPFRVGPSFPLCLAKDAKPPANEGAMFGNRILTTVHFDTFAGVDGWPFGVRMNEESKSLEVMLDHMTRGADILEQIEDPNEKLSMLINLGKFIIHTILTGINARKWHKAKMKLYSAEEKEEFAELLSAMEQILEGECKNAEETIPLVEKDSRLGWEPSMLYMTDRWHIEWKLRYAEYTRSEIKKYRSVLGI